MSAIDKVFHDLSDRMGDRLTQSPGQCEQHAHDLSHFEPRRPEAVAYPQSTEEVQLLVKSCANPCVPIVPFGVGTSLEGHVLPTRGGLCIDMSRMNQVLAVNEADLDVRVQAGVRRKQLNSHLREEVDFGGNVVVQAGWQWRGRGPGHLIRIGMEVRVVAIGLYMVLNRDLDAFLHSFRVGKRFAGPSASVILGQPDVGDSFLWPKLRRVVISSTFL